MTHDTLPEYGGWRNYPTWAVRLWLANEEGPYNRARLIASSGIAANRDMGMQDFVEELLLGDEAPATLGTDLLTWALAYVDWPAVSESFRDE